MLKLVHVSKRYQYQKVLDDVSMELPARGIVAIVGPSGCGKSTLLHIIGGIDRHFQGNLVWQDKSVKHCLTRYRRKHISFIFQQFYLIMWLSVHQNIHLSRFFHPQPKRIDELDIQEFEYLKMASLSLGQQQRIAYLRAYHHHSDILLCDEPTGSLDPNHATEMMKLLKVESQQRLVMIVSHDQKLVEKYSDEIYEMADGRIVDHRVIHHSPIHPQNNSRRKRILFPQLRFSWMSFMSHKLRSIQLIFGLMLSFLCIVLTLTMSRGLKEQINNYIYSLIPASSISFQMNNKQSISSAFIQKLEARDDIERVQLFLDDYENLGIGFVGERYQESQVVFIGDDASPYHDIPLKEGKYPQEDYEIVVSLSTAKHLCQEEPMTTLLNKRIYSWYQHNFEVKAISYKVVGITNQSTTLDTLYQRPNAYIHLLKDVYHYQEEDVKKTLGLIYVHKNYQRSEVVKQLEKQYREYKFVEVGASTTQNVDETMKQVESILIIFSGLAILSSLFLIGEVMFLNVVQKKKDLAIMKCFGANSFNVLKIVLYESFEVVLAAQFLCTVLYYEMLQLMNMIVKEMMGSESLVFHFDYQLLLGVYVISYILVLISQLPPLIYALKINTIESLKGM